MTDRTTFAVTVSEMSSLERDAFDRLRAELDALKTVYPAEARVPFATNAARLAEALAAIRAAKAVR